MRLLMPLFVSWILWTLCHGSIPERYDHGLSMLSPSKNISEYVRTLIPSQLQDHLERVSLYYKDLLENAFIFGGPWSFVAYLRIIYERGFWMYEAYLFLCMARDYFNGSIALPLRSVSFVLFFVVILSDALMFDYNSPLGFFFNMVVFICQTHVFTHLLLNNVLTRVEVVILSSALMLGSNFSKFFGNMVFVVYRAYLFIFLLPFAHFLGQNEIRFMMVFGILQAIYFVSCCSLRSFDCFTIKNVLFGPGLFYAITRISALDAIVKTLNRALRTWAIYVKPLVLRVDRTKIWSDSFDFFTTLQENHVTDLDSIRDRSFRIEFVGEEGFDGGGLTREWATLLSQDLSSSKYSPFTCSKGLLFYSEDSSDGHSEDSSDGHSEDDVLYFRRDGKSQFYAKDAGMFVGLAISKGLQLDLIFSELIYRLMTCDQEIQLSLEDMKFVNIQDYEYLPSMITMEELRSFYETTSTMRLESCSHYQVCRKSIKGSPFSSPKDTDSANEEQQELDPNNQAVKQLKDEIVHKKLYSLLLKDYIEPFLQGIYIFVPKDELIGISPHVLRKQLESGVIDDEAVARWKTITTWYSCPIKGNGKEQTLCSPETWFWDIISSFTPIQRKKLLHFATGSRAIPMKFKIVYGNRDDGLPGANTRGKILYLPFYTTKEKMKQNLLYIVSNDISFMHM